MALEELYDNLSENYAALKDHVIRQKRLYIPLASVIGVVLVLPALLLLLLPTLLSWMAPPLDMTKDLYAVNRPVAYTFLDANNNEVGHRGAIIGKRLTLDQMPAYLPAAFIAMEDRNFYSHGGFDTRGLLRALWVNWRAGHVVQGGSTITQQTVKIVFLNNQRTFARKLDELLDATVLEKSLSKKEILELYLNRIYLGSGAYGVDGAAHVYFNKSAAELSLPEAAMLATLTRAPSAFSPRRDLAGAQARAATVLKAMVETGAITKAEAKAAELQPALVADRTRQDSRNFYFDTAADEAKRLVTSAGAEPATDLVVHTNFDAAIQDAARISAIETLKKSGRKMHAHEAAVVVMKPDGAVVALVGGTDYADSPFNRATQAHRQPGSAFKPFVYLAALESGLTPWDTRSDEPVDINGWTPTNYGGRSYGTLTLADALAHSVNTITANLAQEIGVSNVVQAAERLGIESPLVANASLALGTSEVTPLELTRAYAVFANGGLKVYPYFVTAVEDHGGHLLYQRKPPEDPERVVASHVNRDLVAMLYGVVTEGTGRGAAIAGHQAAGKTGTTQDFHDAWFIGFTKDYVASVWVGNDDATPMKSVTGGSLPATIWHAVMTTAEMGLPASPLDKSEPQPPVDVGIFGSGDVYTPSGSDDESGGARTVYPGDEQADRPPPPPREQNDDHGDFWDWFYNRRGRDENGRPVPQGDDDSQDSN
ncbi:MAG TPA: PBP1A family penicillin-binding protein [Rhizomicrobium sp.]|jgi:penicillin-binding protein 1A